MNPDSMSQEPLELPEPVEVPWQALAPDTLEHLAREFLLREMESDQVMEDEEALRRRSQVLVGRIKRGDFVLTFDPATESVGVAPKTALPRH